MCASVSVVCLHGVCHHDRTWKSNENYSAASQRVGEVQGRENGKGQETVLSLKGSSLTPITRPVPEPATVLCLAINLPFYVTLSP